MKIFLVQLVLVAVVAVCSAKKGGAKSKCFYQKDAHWSECENGKQTVSKVLDEVKSKGTNCPRIKNKVRNCVPGKKSKCEYTKGNWSDCNDATGMQTRSMQLQKGGELCAPTKIKTRKCKKGCKYIKGNWSPCDPVTKKRSRVLTLQGGGKHCQPTKTREKKCKKMKAGKKGRPKRRRSRLKSRTDKRSLSVLPSVFSTHDPTTENSTHSSLSSLPVTSPQIYLRVTSQGKASGTKVGKKSRRFRSKSRKRWRKRKLKGSQKSRTHIPKEAAERDGTQLAVTVETTSSTAVTSSNVKTSLIRKRFTEVPEASERSTTPFSSLSSHGTKGSAPVSTGVPAVSTTSSCTWSWFC